MLMNKPATRQMQKPIRRCAVGGAERLRARRSSRWRALQRGGRAYVFAAHRARLVQVINHAGGFRLDAHLRRAALREAQRRARFGSAPPRRNRRASQRLAAARHVLDAKTTAFHGATERRERRTRRRARERRAGHKGSARVASWERTSSLTLSNAAPPRPMAAARLAAASLRCAAASVSAARQRNVERKRSRYGAAGPTAATRGVWRAAVAPVPRRRSTDAATRGAEEVRGHAWVFTVSHSRQARR